MGYAKDGRLKCDGWCGHAGTVTHIDEKGYAYCTPCGTQRKASHRCRKLTGAEIKRLQAGLTISYERPRKEHAPDPLEGRAVAYLVTFTRGDEDAEVAATAGRTGAQQLAAELQEACDAGILNGTFEIHGEALP